MNKLKHKMLNGPVYGMSCYTGAIPIVETIAMSGLDFIYLDTEHTVIGVGEALEKQIMAAKLHDIAVLARVAQDDPVQIRKVLEMGADGVIIPHCTSAAMAKKCVEAAKFAPMGRRGAESAVRAAGFGYDHFDWNEYIRRQNEDSMVILIDEDFEFTENIDEILAVEGIDAINFGPVDYANSLCEKIGYAMGDRVREAFDILVKKAAPRNIGILGPVPSCDPAGIKLAQEQGYNMCILGNDMMHFTKGLRKAVEDTKAI